MFKRFQMGGGESEAGRQLRGEVVVGQIQVQTGKQVDRQAADRLVNS